MPRPVGSKNKKAIKVANTIAIEHGNPKVHKTTVVNVVISDLEIHALVKSKAIELAGFESGQMFESVSVNFKKGTAYVELLNPTAVMTTTNNSGDTLHIDGSKL